MGDLRRSGSAQGDKVRLFWAAEGGFETADPGFDPHLAPDPTPLWNILDWTPGGRGTDWYPKLEYEFVSLQFFGHPFSSYTQKVLIPLFADGRRLHSNIACSTRIIRRTARSSGGTLPSANFRC